MLQVANKLIFSITLNSHAYRRLFTNVAHLSSMIFIHHPCLSSIISIHRWLIADYFQGSHVYRRLFSYITNANHRLFPYIVGLSPIIIIHRTLIVDYFHTLRACRRSFPYIAGLSSIISIHLTCFCRKFHSSSLHRVAARDARAWMLFFLLHSLVLLIRNEEIGRFCGQVCVCLCVQYIVRVKCYTEDELVCNL